MGTFKTFGTPLAGSGLLDDHHLRKMQALSVTTVEEMLGLIAADPGTVVGFMEGSDLPKLQADAGMLGKSQLIATQQRVSAEIRGRPLAMGARPPVGVDVEERASVETFDRYFETFKPGVAAGDPGSGADLRDCCGPIRNQGERGTCVAFAGCALLECALNADGQANDHSEQFLYWMAKQHDGIPNDAGTYLEVAVPLMVQYGVCLESDWVYNPQPIPGNESQGPPPAGAEAAALRYKADAFEQMNNRSPAAIRESLDAGRAVAVSVPVYDNWYSNPSTRTVGTIPMPLPNSVLRGGHAMCAIGYDYDDDFTGGGYFILRNSWGEGWASMSPIAPGYGAIPFAYIENYGWETFRL